MGTWGWGRIPIEYSSTFQVCPFKVLVSTDWSAPGQGKQLILTSALVLRVCFCCFSGAWS